MQCLCGVNATASAPRALTGAGSARVRSLKADSAETAASAANGLSPTSVADDHRAATSQDFLTLPPPLVDGSVELCVKPEKEGGAVPFISLSLVKRRSKFSTSASPAVRLASSWMSMSVIGSEHKHIYVGDRSEAIN